MWLWRTTKRPLTFELLYQVTHAATLQEIEKIVGRPPDVRIMPLPQAANGLVECFWADRVHRLDATTSPDALRKKLVQSEGYFEESPGGLLCGGMVLAYVRADGTIYALYPTPDRAMFERLNSFVTGIPAPVPMPPTAIVDVPKPSISFEQMPDHSQPGASDLEDRSVRVGRIMIVGNTMTPEGLILRTLGFSVGENVKKSDLEEAEKNLAETGLFIVSHSNHVRPTVRIIDPEYLGNCKDVLVRIVERE
jgi:hypothetical protein